MHSWHLAGCISRLSRISQVAWVCFVFCHCTQCQATLRLEHMCWFLVKLGSCYRRWKSLQTIRAICVKQGSSSRERNRERETEQTAVIHTGLWGWPQWSLAWLPTPCVHTLLWHNDRWGLSFHAHPMTEGTQTHTATQPYDHHFPARNWQVSFSLQAFAFRVWVQAETAQLASIALVAIAHIWAEETCVKNNKWVLVCCWKHHKEIVTGLASCDWWAAGWKALQRWGYGYFSYWGWKSLGEAYT